MTPCSCRERGLPSPASLLRREGGREFQLGEYGAIKVSPVYFHPDPEDSSLSPTEAIYLAENKRSTFSSPVTKKERERESGWVDVVADRYFAETAYDGAGGRASDYQTLTKTHWVNRV